MQYVEEPVQDTRDLGAFFDQTHIPTALDETLDEAVSGKHASSHPPAMTPQAILQHLISQLPKGAIAALVVKPGVVGGFEKASGVSQWAAAHNIQVGPSCHIGTGWQAEKESFCHASTDLTCLGGSCSVWLQGYSLATQNI